MTSLEIRQHNSTVLTELEEGDLVEFNRGLYSHWGVYIGNEEIVHLTGVGNDGINGQIDLKHFFSISGERFDKAVVVRENFWKVTGETKAIKNNNKDVIFSPLNPMEIVERALSKIGEIGYNVLWNNCEHFAAYCRYDKHLSEQSVKVCADAFGLALQQPAVLLAAGIGYGIYHFVKKKQEKDQNKGKLKSRNAWF